MDGDGAKKEVARRISRADDELRAEFGVAEGGSAQFVTLLRLGQRALRPLEGSHGQFVEGYS